ncbi:hypothetical protein [Leptolyngbya sp. NIES-2104]|uniref:hypothetical protein n=1 Tax=Leptolyngbya sp. NIES-2104 TaxID=1552121 RepID=UPI0006EC6F57|nr:hypothetical protein [Leptolyngbya sp. NIES-2104]GAP93753.1 hypothetical protein NIES2104_02610 [Leptolyngbya sp. NIES-2104]
MKFGANSAKSTEGDWRENFQLVSVVFVVCEDGDYLEGDRAGMYDRFFVKVD